jgi:hypothetical protein
MYTVETNVSTDPNQPANTAGDCKFTVYPRMGRGMMGIVTKLLLFESSGQSIGDKKLEKMFNFSYDDRVVAQRFFNYPGIADHLMVLENLTKFTEIVIRTKVGIYLSQSCSFNGLDLDVCRATFRALGEMGQVLFEAFSA